MQRTKRCDDKPKRERPRLEVADVLRTHGEAYQQRYVLTPQQHKVFRNLQACRTELLGGHLDICNSCGHSVPAFNSCRDRHCPKCQSLEQARWVLQRMERVLPVPYFHVVFTMPSELRPIARRNRAVFYSLLFKAASQTLLELGRDGQRLGATLGVTAVLHTWTRELHFFPHVHCIVTGGGLALDGSRWVRPRYDGEFLFPVFVLSKLFRGKFLALLAKAVERGEITLGDSDGEADEFELERQAFALLKDKLYRKKWVAYAKRPFAGPKQVFRYLGLYTHRVGISNHRLLSMENGKVTFATKDGGTATLTGVEFIRRFLQHVLPKGFRKIRHYGLHAPSNVNTKLEKARQLLAAEGLSPKTTPEIPDTWQEFVELLIGENPTACPQCKDGVLIRYPIDPATGGLLPPKTPEPDT